MTGPQATRAEWGGQGDGVCWGGGDGDDEAPFAYRYPSPMARGSFCSRPVNQVPRFSLSLPCDVMSLLTS